MNAAFDTLAAGSLLNAAALLFLFVLLGRNVLLTPQREMAYRAAILLTVLVMGLEVACAALDLGSPGWHWLNALCNAVGFGASGALPYLLAAAYDERLARRWRQVMAAPLALAALSVLSVGTGWVFSVSRQNVYARGPLFVLYELVLLGGIGLLAAANLRQSRRLFRWERAYLALLFFLFPLGLSIQLLHPGLHTSWQCVTLTLLLYYVFQRELQFRYDQLTGVLNRATFDRAAKKLRPGTSLIIFDLDDFKSVNDTYGHQTGDACLRDTADILRQSFAAIGPCYRIGGDEFAVLGRCTQRRFRAGTAEMLSRLAAGRKSGRLLPGISYGQGVLEKGETFGALFRRTDAQMYRFKRGQAGGRTPQPAANDPEP